jgi:hypothetical protein
VRTVSGFAQHVVTGDRHGSAVRFEQRREDPDRGRLAGAIGPEKRQNRSQRHGEVNILDGLRLPERPSLFHVLRR